MLARIRKALKEKDEGFTLIELLVVMIIIGILAAIAIPVFLNQRKKAVDTGVKSDVTNAGKSIATYYVDGTLGTIVASATAGQLTIGSSSTNTSDIASVRLSDKNTTTTTPAVGYSSGTGCGSNYAISWWIGLTNPNGSSSGGTWYYSAQLGLTNTSPASAPCTNS